MLNKSFLIGCFLLFVGQVLFAQDKQVDFSDEKVVISDYREQLTISFSKSGKLEANTSVTQQTRLQKKEGLSLVTDKDIYHGFFNELDDVKAYTVKAGKRGKKIPLLKKETKSDQSRYVFYEDGKITTLYFGELEPGSSTYLNYKLKHRDINILPSKFVQNYLPIEKFVYKVVTPQKLNIRFSNKFYGFKKLKYTVENKKNQTIHTFSGSDIPAYDPPKYSPPIKYFLPHIVPIVESYQDTKKGKEIIVTRDVKDLYSYYQSYMTKANLEPDEEVRKMSNSIVGDLKTDREKAKAIFDWVKNKIKYVAFEDAYGGFVPRLAKDICNKRYGDCKDMATLLVHLLRSQDLKAYHTWIGTRAIPYSYSEVPTSASDNHMICALDLDNEWVILDATANFIPFGYIPNNIQGKEALIGVGKDSFIVKKLAIAPSGQNVIKDTTWMQIENKTVKGTIHLNISGYKAIDAKTMLSYKDAKDKEDYIKRYLYRGNNKCLLDNVKWTHPDEETIDITADFILDNYLQEVSGDIYMNTMLTKPFSGFRIKDEKRNVKVDNKWANRVEYVSFLKIPDGYKVHYKPDNMKLKADNHYSADVRFEQKADKLMSSLKISYELLDIQPNQLSDHNKLVDKLEKTYVEVVQLKK